MGPAGSEFSVAILGGGPAGCVAAKLLAEAEYSTAVLERSSYVGPRVGETLPPSVQPLLHQLGLWEYFEKDAHAPSAGIVSAWGNNRPHESDFIFTPFGNGWHLDRTKFDSTLARCAEMSGAKIIQSA